MRRLVWIFLAAIATPCLILAWLAIHSVRDQQILLEHQQASISQSITDSKADAIRQQIDSIRNDFEHTVQQWMHEDSPVSELANTFNMQIANRWPLAEIGFVVDQNGVIYSPRPTDGARARQFRLENERFLSNRENVELYTSNVAAAPATKGEIGADTQLTLEATPQSPAASMENTSSTEQTTAATSQTPIPATPEVSKQRSKEVSQSFSKISRRVSPQQNIAPNAEVLSQVMPEESDFRRAIASQTSGTLARFLDNKLQILVWCRSSTAPNLIFGAQLNPQLLIEKLKPSLAPDDDHRGSYSSSRSKVDYCLAILNDSGQPVALSVSGFTTDWKHPFVSTEIGEVLPHWEVAFYWLDPQQMSHAARILQWTLGLIVLVLIAAIVVGGYLIAMDVRRQTRLAQQKTDFVSNVSHELKTPLTSIRMFADLLAEKRVQDEQKQEAYLRIIAAESSRLTRLINNVLDFARMERGAAPTKPLPCDLVEIVLEVAETCRPHLEATGIAFQVQMDIDTLPVSGHRDSLAQIILNLLSNAEKYGGGDILLRVRLDDMASHKRGRVDLLDRGHGIAASQIKAIFEPFHRLEDSLASGIPGSGLGLTLARRLARQHHGDISYHPREGGGSCFTLTLPLSTETPSA